MDTAGTPVTIEDQVTPRRPKLDIDRLIDYLRDVFPQRKRHIQDLIFKAKQLRHKEDTVDLGYEISLFRSELDDWIPLAEQIYSEEFADKFDTAHSERTDEVSDGQSARRPNAKLIETQAKKYTAVLKRALSQLQDTRDWLDRTLFWVGQQQKMIAADEYGDYLDSSNRPAEERYAPPVGASAPSVGDALDAENRARTQ